MKIFVINMLGKGEKVEDVPRTAAEWLREPRPSPRWRSKGLGRGTRLSPVRRAPGGVALTAGTFGISPPSGKRLSGFVSQRFSKHPLPDGGTHACSRSELDHFCEEVTWES